MDAGTFEIGTKIIGSYVPSLPPGFLIQRHEHIKPPIKGTENGFKFYVEKYNYVSAKFNLIYDFKGEDPKTCFYRQCEVMVSTLCYLNDRDLKPLEIRTIVSHISSKGNYIFNVDALYSHLIAYQPNLGEVVIKARDFNLLERKNYDTSFQFVNANNVALKLVNISYNHKNIFDLLQERISNNDYDFIEKQFLIGDPKNNKLSHLIIFKFNLLVTGRKRKERYGLKKYPITNIYSLFIKSLSLKRQQQNANIQKGVLKYERELKELNRLINNRPKAQQLVNILRDILGEETEVNIVPNLELINELKADLYSTIKNTILKDATAGARDFDLMYPKKMISNIKPIEGIKNIFNTNIDNSVFNQLEPEEAYSRGDVFFTEYLTFNKDAEVEEREKNSHIPKQVYRLTEINFNQKANH